MKFLVKIRDIHKFEKKISIAICLFDYWNNEKYLIYVSKNVVKKHADLLLIGEKDKRRDAFIKYFSTFMYDDRLHRGWKQKND